MAIETAANKISQLNSTKNPGLSTAGTLNRSNSSSGAVLFTNNICQLEARASQQKAFSSVSIVSLDSLIFEGNQCWVDGPRLTAFVDILLGAGTIQLTSNRLQEGAGFPVIASGLTFGVINIAAQNLSTYCLFVRGTTTIDVNNISIIGLADQSICPRLAKLLQI